MFITRGIYEVFRQLDPLAENRGTMMPQLVLRCMRFNAANWRTVQNHVVKVHGV